MKKTRVLVLIIAFSGSCLRAEELPSGEDFPEALSGNDFAALRQTSPFTRVLSLPATYALRGVATINNQQVATLYNRETKKSILVTPNGENDAGIALVEVTPASDLEGVAATISFAGDEAELKYELSQIFPQPRPPGAGKGGEGKEGERRGPSPQDIERFKALPEEKQAKLRDYIGHVMRNYPEMSREEKGNLIRGAMIRLTDGRDIEVPPAPPPGKGGSGGDQRSPGKGEGRERGESRERR
jgi:hypothetical protein